MTCRHARQSRAVAHRRTGRCSCFDWLDGRSSAAAKGTHADTPDGRDLGGSCAICVKLRPAPRAINSLPHARGFRRSLRPRPASNGRRDHSSSRRSRACGQVVRRGAAVRLSSRLMLLPGTPKTARSSGTMPRAGSRPSQKWHKCLRVGAQARNANAYYLAA